MLIDLNSVYKSYGQTEVLKDINLQVKAGEDLVIQGASGSGKSTLLYILGTLEQPDKGLVKIDGNDIATLHDEKSAKLRNSLIGFVFQFHFLLPSMNCLQNIYLPGKIAGISPKSIKDRVHEYADALNVSHCLEKYPFEISGGEQQRINIIRAISLNPKLILCDEPTGNLDSKNTNIVINMLKNLSQKIDSTLIIVTHDDQVARSFERKITIEDGQIIG